MKDKGQKIERRRGRQESNKLKDQGRTKYIEKKKEEKVIMGTEGRTVDKQ